jgi:hypothetical protein
VMLYSNPHDGAFYAAAPGLAPLSGQQLGHDRPDLHLQVVNDNQAVAYASLWFDGPRIDPDQPTGLIGHYAASTNQAAKILLEGSLAALKAQGCRQVIGPMDGSSWKSYRFVAEAGVEAPFSAPFFLEPQQPAEYLAQFLAAGLTPLAHYHSALVVHPPPDPKMPAVRARLAHNGVSIAAIAPNRLTETLQHIYRLSLVSFRHNLLYTPISEAVFLALYQPLLAQLPPEFTRLAWWGQDHPELVGYAFAVPDLLRPQRDTLIIKTVAVRPGRMFAGLGRLLNDDLNQLAHQMQMPRVIHALMHDHNTSAIISRKTGKSQIIRRYLLLGCEL